MSDVRTLLFVGERELRQGSSRTSELVSKDRLTIIHGHLGYSPGGGRVIPSGSKMTLCSPFSTKPTSVS